MAAPRFGFVGFVLVLAGAALGALSAAPADAAAPRVVDFTPQGTVKAVRQVVARFSDPMVPFGDLRAVQPPFQINCSEPGSGRWVDTRTWAFDFNRDLPAGIRCAFTQRPGLKTLSGKALAATSAFRFSTGGPAVITSSPTEGDETIDEEQAFVLVLDGEASEQSIVEHAHFAVEGLPDSIGVRLVTGPTRDAILATFWKDFFSGPTVVLQARQRFPNETPVTLVWGAGISGAAGVATEHDQRLTFKTRPAFTAQVRCDRENAHADCVPLTPLRLVFSAAVPREQALQAVLRGPDGHTWPATSDDSGPSVERVEFEAPFPPSSSLRLEIPADLHDDAGRALVNAGEFPREVKLAPFPPLAKFAARFGIIEAHAEPALPVTVRRLEPKLEGRLLPLGNAAATTVSGQVARLGADQAGDVLPWLRLVARAGRTTSIFRSPPAPASEPSKFTLPRPNGADAFEVMGIPFSRPGLYVVELASLRLGQALLGEDKQMYVQAAALVTNLGVHFKWGRDNAIAWVTTLDSARPVAGARVQVRNCRGELLWEGTSDDNGVAWINGLPARSNVTTCYDAWPQLGPDADNEQREYVPALNDLAEGLVVSADLNDDFAFVHSEWKEGIEPWRFQLPAERFSGPNLKHTILDRPLFRVGDTVHMKHVLRRDTLDGFGATPDAERPTKLSIRHVGSNDAYEMPLTWDASGTAESTWTIPPGAKLGRYTVSLPNPDRDMWGDEAAQFQVQEFRVPLMRGTVNLPAGPLVNPSEVPVDVALQYLNGGGAANADVTVRAQLRDGSLRRPEGFESHTFANGRITVGTTRRGTPSEDDGTTPKPSGVLERRSLRLDATGSGRTQIASLPASEELRDLAVEMEFRDPNGETQTARSTVSLWPAAQVIGIHAERWAGSTRAVRAQVVVLDTDAKPVANAAVQVDVLQRNYFSARKRLVGGFYAYEDVEEITAHGKLCEGKTDVSGQFVCEGNAPVDGNLVLQAETKDTAGRISSAHDEVWVTDNDEWRFEGGNSDRIDLIPEQRRYEPGDNARLQVRTPFREATALVTVEREGIAAAWVMTLSNTNPVISLPILPEYSPNVFVSAFLVRGRVGDVQPTATVDLGRPAFKLGIAELRVGWKAHELKVAVTSDRPVYRVRDKAKVEIAVHSADGTPLPAGSEIALAAVDEGLLELLPNKSWNLLDAMMGERSYSVQTATAQMQVIGKRHYGLKALPQGGGGGRSGTRELFDTLLLWQPRVALDAAGHASVEVPLNDSLTSFRIEAIATAGVGRFGNGGTSIRTTQDLMLLSGLPAAVRDGDRFPAEFTVRNTSDHGQQVSLGGRVEPSIGALGEQTIELNAGEARVVGWPIQVPAGVDELVYEIHAKSGDQVHDELRVKQRVSATVPVRTLQATLKQVDKSVDLPVQAPADALPARGGVAVTLSPRMAGSVESMREAMRKYPYSCLEQLVSIAIALHDEARWAAIVDKLPAYQDSDGLLKFFPSMPQGSEVLTSYVLSITAAARSTVLPAAVQQRMESGLQQFINGNIQRQSAIPTADLALRKLGAIAALARVGKATPAMLGSVPLDPPLWPMSALLDWWTILDKLPSLPNREARLKEVDQLVHSRLTVQGSLQMLSGDEREKLWWLLGDADVSATRLLLQVVDSPKWKDDIAPLARGVLSRMQRGQWSTTIANAWGTLAFDHFSRRFEGKGVDGVARLELGTSKRVLDWSATPGGETVLLPWPPGPGTLHLTQEGNGGPWATVESRAAVPLSKPLSSGYQIKRTVTPLETRAAGSLHRGDVLRVQLDIEAQSDMTWVVIDDPLPTGAAHLAAGFGRETTMLGSTPGSEELLAPSFVERGQQSYRAYFAYVPKGHVRVDYAIRLNQAGSFPMPETRVEALYAREMFGAAPNATLTVEP